MIPAIVRCEERYRLLLLYALAVHAYCHANTRARGQHDLFEANRRVNEARNKCEAARQVLVKHRKEHGC
jgi:hypothetical protein